MRPAHLCFGLCAVLSGCGQALEVPVDLAEIPVDMADPCALPGYLDVGTPPSELPHSCVINRQDDHHNIALCRDADGIYAMDPACRNECQVDEIATGPSCPCHGPSYDFYGMVLGTPESGETQLLYSPVCIDSAGLAWVNPLVNVPASTRY